MLDGFDRLPLFKRMIACVTSCNLQLNLMYKCMFVCLFGWMDNHSLQCQSKLYTFISRFRQMNHLNGGDGK